MCADLASLEVWLAFRLADNDPLDETEWHSVIDYLYAPETIDRMFAGGPCETAGWLSDCVHTIREFAPGAAHSVDEYSRVLAIYLLRWSSFSAVGKTHEVKKLDEERRAYAYWLANRLIAHIDGSCANG
jgi:hypothetical protein